MNINQIKPKSPVDSVMGCITALDETREVRGGSLRIRTATIIDATGECQVTLWNDDCEKVKLKDIIKITQGWAGEYQGKIQLSAGKFGTLTIINFDDAEALVLKRSIVIPKTVKQATLVK